MIKESFIKSDKFWSEFQPIKKVLIKYNSSKYTKDLKYDKSFTNTINTKECSQNWAKYCFLKIHQCCEKNCQKAKILNNYESFDDLISFKKFLC